MTDQNSYPQLVAALHGCDTGRNCFYDHVGEWPDTFSLPVEAAEGVGVWTFRRITGRQRRCDTCTVSVGGECVAPCLIDASWAVSDPDGQVWSYCVRDLYDMVPWPQLAPGGDGGSFWLSARG